MNSISLNFSYYEHHLKGQDLCQSRKIDKKSVDMLMQKTNIIQIARQQYWTFEQYKDILDKNYIVLYILRDGRDVMDSLYDMHRKEYKWSSSSTLGDFLCQPMEDRSYEARINFMPAINPIESWIIHWQSWLMYFKTNYYNLPDNFIFYESLCNDFDNTIIKIAKILNQKPHHNRVRPVKEFNSVKPRQGIPGQWENSFTEFDIKYYNNYLLQRVPGFI